MCRTFLIRATITPAVICEQSDKLSANEQCETSRRLRKATISAARFDSRKSDIREFLKITLPATFAARYSGGPRERDNHLV